MIKKKNISQEDINTWNSFIKNPNGITDKDKVQTINQPNKNRFKYDLHGFSLLEANYKAKELILLCVCDSENEKNF